MVRARLMGPPCALDVTLLSSGHESRKRTTGRPAAVILDMFSLLFLSSFFCLDLCIVSFGVSSWSSFPRTSRSKSCWHVAVRNSRLIAIMAIEYPKQWNVNDACLQCTAICWNIGSLAGFWNIDSRCALRRDGGQDMQRAWVWENEKKNIGIN